MDSYLISMASSGRACALRFSQAYPVVLLARRPESYKDVVDEIKKRGGQAFGFAADVTDGPSLDAAFNEIKKELPGAKLAAAVFNASSGFAVKPFLELKTQNLDDAMAGVSVFFSLLGRICAF